MRITKPPKSGVFKKKDSTIKDINPIIIKIHPKSLKVFIKYRKIRDYLSLILYYLNELNEGAGIFKKR